MSDSRPPFDPFGSAHEGTGLPPSPPVADSWAVPGSGPVWPPAPAANPYAAPVSPPGAPGGPYNAPPAAPANPYAAPPSAPVGSYSGPYAGQPASPYAAYPGSFGATSPTPPPHPVVNTRRHNQLAFIGGLLVATLLIAAVVLVHNGLNSGSTTNTQASPPITIPAPTGSSNGGAAGSGSSATGSGSTGSGTGSGTTLSTEAITAAVEPGVVDIDTRLGYQSAAAAGTGMILTSNGLVLTNNHVIDGATSITATVVGTGRTYTASVVGTDVTEDIAVLRLSGASGLTTVPLGDSSTVSTGDKVVAIGNAGGTGGDPTVVTGTVTDLNQSITASDENGTNAEQLTGLIVTNAPIVAGDSGGPLSNAQGRVIGIDTAASANNQYMSANSTGFAIPINHALAIAREIEAGNETDTIHIGATGFLGIAMAPPGNGTGTGSGSGLGASSGSTADDPATVSTVIAGSPADKAGIVAGDTITAFDGTSISSAEALQKLTHRRHPGDQVSISWTDSSGQSHQATITLATGPAA